MAKIYFKVSFDDEDKKIRKYHKNIVTIIECNPDDTWMSLLKHFKGFLVQMEYGPELLETFLDENNDWNNN